MEERITVYYDYTCPYSYRVLRWLETVKQTGRELTLIWRTFSLKEVNRRAEDDSFLADTPVQSVSILALMLAKAAQAHGTEVFERYHEAAFEAMQGQHRRLERPDVLSLAREAGLDVDRFETEGVERLRKWLAAVRTDHREGVARWKVFGTPTLVFQDEMAAYLKFTAVPRSPEEAAEVLDALLCLARCHPELVEIKYPQAA
jgi:predicted DsbA family dithiol-disulfide isomerase